MGTIASYTQEKITLFLLLFKRNFFSPLRCHFIWNNFFSYISYFLFFFYSVPIISKKRSFELKRKKKCEKRQKSSLDFLFKNRFLVLGKKRGRKFVTNFFLRFLLNLNCVYLSCRLSRATYIHIQTYNGTNLIFYQEAEMICNNNFLDGRLLLLLIRKNKSIWEAKQFVYFLSIWKFLWSRQS